MKTFFMAHTYLELNLNEEALALYGTMTQNGLQHSTYIMAQTAVAYHNLRSKLKLNTSFEAILIHRGLNKHIALSPDWIQSQQVKFSLPFLL